MTLTEISFYSRKIAPFAIIMLLVLLIFYYAFRVFLLYMQTNTTVQGPQLQLIFGQIKQPYFGNKPNTSGYEFVLDTLEGQPISASDTAKIYYIPQEAPKYRYRQQVYLMAKAVGFDTDTAEYKLASLEASFEDGKKKLTVDISTFNFTYEANLEALKQESTFTGTGTIPSSEQEIINTAVNFLTSVNRYPKELSQGRRNIVYVTYNPEQNTLTLAPKDQTTNVVEVDFFRPDIDSFPVLTPSYFNSPNYVLIHYDDTGKGTVLRSKVQYFEPSTTEIGVYPLQSGSVAWEMLKAGKGVIVAPYEGSTQVTIRSMLWGYYDSDSYQTHLQPVYVFLGDDNFVAYVPAVDSSYVSP